MEQRYTEIDVNSHASEEEEYEEEEEEVNLDDVVNIQNEEAYESLEKEIYDDAQIDPAEQIIEYFENSKIDEVKPLVAKLNEIRNIKLCGGLGSCFNCRNKHIKQVGRNQLLDTHESTSLGANLQNTVNSSTGYNTANNSNKNTIRQKYGEYFKKQLSKIIEPKKPTMFSDFKMKDEKTPNTASSV